MTSEERYSYEVLRSDCRARLDSCLWNKESYEERLQSVLQTEAGFTEYQAYFEEKQAAMRRTLAAFEALGSRLQSADTFGRVMDDALNACGSYQTILEYFTGAFEAIGCRKRELMARIEALEENIALEQSLLSSYNRILGM